MLLCQRIPVQCQRCFIDIPQSEEENHKGECEMGLVVCGCGEDKQAHKESVCRNKKTECLFGCGESAKSVQL